MLYLDIRTSDPLGILQSTKGALEHARFVSLNFDALPAAAERVRARYEQGLGTPAETVGATGDTATDIQRVFVQDAVNFSFWPRPGATKWWVAVKGYSLMGWYAIVACVSRALAEGIPILDAKYLADISTADVRGIFRGEGGTELPILAERAIALREAGAVLLSRFSGTFMNAVARAQFDAVELTKLITGHFPSFRDRVLLDENAVVFLKRAQIVSNDLAYVLRNTQAPLRNVDQLTAFADYKLPQVLRHFGVLRYTTDLATRVDQLQEIQSGTREEIEIRAATVWTVELIRQRLHPLTAADVDNALWLLGRDLAHEMQPHHRTRTICY